MKFYLNSKNKVLIYFIPFILLSCSSKSDNVFVDKYQKDDDIDLEKDSEKLDKNLVLDSLYLDYFNQIKNKYMMKNFFDSLELNQLKKVLDKLGVSKDLDLKDMDILSAGNQLSLLREEKGLSSELQIKILYILNTKMVEEQKEFEKIYCALDSVKRKQIKDNKKSLITR